MKLKKKKFHFPRLFIPPVTAAANNFLGSLSVILVGTLTPY
jgi:hypothetical protein